MFAVSEQSALSQQTGGVVEMHSLRQTFSPAAQAHVPPGAGQVSPVMGQPVAGQQLVVAMHVSFVVQYVSPVGQLHDPPGPEQV